MPALVPKPKSVELIDRINLELHRDPPNEVAVEHVRREATALMRVAGHEAEAHSILGMVATIKIQPSEVLGHFRQAVAMGGDDGVNASISYLRVGLFSEACKLAEMLWASKPDDIEALKQASSIFFRSAQITKAAQIYAALRKLGKELPETVFEKYSESISSVFSAANLDEAQLIPILETAANVVVVDHKKPLLETYYSLTPAGEIAYSFAINAGVDELVDMNFEIADKISSKFERTYSSVFTVSCLSSERS